MGRPGPPGVNGTRGERGATGSQGSTGNFSSCTHHTEKSAGSQKGPISKTDVSADEGTVSIYVFFFLHY